MAWGDRTLFSMNMVKSLVSSRRSDEWFIYPDHEKIPLAALTAYLTGTGHRGCFHSCSTCMGPVSSRMRLPLRGSLLADSDEAGRVFRFESGHRSDLKAAGVALPSGSLG